MDKVFLGSKVSNLDTDAEPPRISRVVLRVDSERTYTAGDESGSTLEKTCPWGSQAMAESILASVRNVTYLPYTGEDGLLDPAAEVGDGITLGGFYSVLAQTAITFDSLYTAELAAPGADEADEYPYQSRESRLFERQLAGTRSYITKTAEQIRLEVSSELEGMEASITVELDRITQTVEDTANNLRTEFTVALDGITGRVQNAEGDIGQLQLTATGLSTRISTAEGSITSLQLTANGLQSEVSNTNRQVAAISQKVDSIRLEVTNGAESSYFELRSGSAVLSSGNITLTGMVTFNDLQGNQTIINGSTIDTKTLYLDSLYGNTVYIRDSAGRIAASFEATGAVSTAKSALAIWSGAVKIQTYNSSGSGGDIYINAMTGSVTLNAAEAVTCGNDFYPMSNNRYTCGTSSFRWQDVYTIDGPISGSDRAEKTDISYDLSRYEALFDALRPCSFRRRDGSSGRTHTGLIAQDVAAALEEAGLTAQDFAGYCAWGSPAAEDGAGCGLRYEELIGLLVCQVQQLKKEMSRMKGAVG